MRQDVFDPDALEPEAGVRAIWILYKKGKWGYMEDLGMARGEAEPALQQFEADHLLSDRLNKAQCRKLEQAVPGLREARKELQLAYVLKFLDQGVNIGEQYGKVLSRDS